MKCRVLAIYVLVDVCVCVFVCLFVCSAESVGQEHE